MPRPLTPAVRAAMYASQTGDAILTLLTLSHPSMPEPIRLVNDGRNLVSRGATYVRCPFDLEYPSDNDGVPQPARLRVANADRSILVWLRQLQGDPLTATMELVAASAPDDVVLGPVEFTMRSTPYTAEFIEADLTFDDRLSEACPADHFLPSTSPGLF